MAKPTDKLAESLEVLRSLQKRGHIAIQSKNLTRLHRERLKKAGFLKEVMRGWYIPARPNESAGESTPWYASYWQFCGTYLQARFGTKWSLSPEQSVLLLAGNKTVPAQLLVRAPQARNQVTRFPHETSLFEVRAALPEKSDLITNEDNLKLFSLPSALIQCSEDFYTRYPTDARTALSMLQDASDILAPLLEGGHSVVAGRIAGALRNIGRGRMADTIMNAMRAANYLVQERDPFVTQLAGNVLQTRERSPYVNRIRLMWQSMREQIIQAFPASPGMPEDIDAYMKAVADSYAQDAYNSLSIEGYRVSAELIEQVRSGKWAPDTNENDKQQRDAMAARGYWLAYQEVQKSLLEILKGKNAGEVADYDHGTWYLKMFEPSVTVGLLKASDLAGYRSGPVYIRRSMHTPPNAEAVRDLMPVFFELLANEPEASVRVVLGHFIFVYIHPYIDGNGRIGRFLMNAMLASGGYPWTIVPLAVRDEYMNALEQASVAQDIKPFAELIGRLVREALKQQSA
ncbi:MAG: Fic family protein [Sphingobacteriales bacterium JAD_PAG50586_3]|nr:MAG: Fic family protein [Sphingobacteriales bacterium JAD_PAG50586_3]